MSLFLLKLVEFLQDPDASTKCECVFIISRVLDKLSDSFKANKVRLLFFDLINSKQ